MKVVTAPDVSESRWELVYLPSMVTKDLATAIGRPDTEGSHRFQVKPESIRTASPKSINWFMQATPYDNLGHELPPKELIGLMTFSFDLIIPAGEVLWTETYTRDATWAGAGQAVPLRPAPPLPEAGRPGRLAASCAPPRVTRGRASRPVRRASPGATAAATLGRISVPMTGQGLCGAVRFKVDAPLLGALYCHWHALPAAHRQCILGQRDHGAGVVPDHRGRGARAPWRPPDGLGEGVLRGSAGATPTPPT